MTKHGLISKRYFLSLILLLIVSSPVLSQTREGMFPFHRTGICVETNFTPSDTGYVCFISYRVPYDNLIFVKNGDRFSGGVTLDFELINGGQFVKRQTSSQNVFVNSYDSTLSSTDYLQGVLSIIIGKKDYVLNPFASLTNGERNIHLDSIKINQKEISQNNVLQPIVVVHDGASCSKEVLFQLVNFENTIPFSPSAVDLLVPVTDTSISKLDLEISQENKTVLKKTLTESVKDNFGFVDCSQHVVLERRTDRKLLKYFYLPDFNKELSEGPAKISITMGKDARAEFKTRVLWNDKPKSLINPEFAIQYLEAIESADKIDYLLSKDKDEYYKALTEYWNAKYPDKTHAFNELEFEFYQRVDYALRHFGSVANKNGAKTDRGTTYIRYGQPDEIKRDYNNSNMAIEIWTYKRLNKEFLFTDKTGLGNYTLGE